METNFMNNENEQQAARHDDVTVGCFYGCVFVAAVTGIIAGLLIGLIF